MSEAEILQLSFDANEAVASIFSIFFGATSAYIAALYFFLNRSPLPIRFTAFFLLSAGFLFLGQAMSGVEARIEGLVRAWDKLGPTASEIARLNVAGLPLPVRDFLDTIGYSQFVTAESWVAIYSGWLVASCIYVALFYFTFVYKWPVR